MLALLTEVVFFLAITIKGKGITKNPTLLREYWQSLAILVYAIGV